MFFSLHASKNQNQNQNQNRFLNQKISNRKRHVSEKKKVNRQRMRRLSLMGARYGSFFEINYIYNIMIDEDAVISVCKHRETERERERREKGAYSMCAFHI